MSTDLLAVTLAVAEDEVAAGPLGLLVVVLMILATVLLIRNMNSRLRRLPREFPPPSTTDDEDQDRPVS